MKSALVAIVVGSLMAGCLGAGDDPKTDVSLEPLPGKGLYPKMPAATAPFSLFLCRDDGLVELAQGATEACNFHATPDSGPAAEVSLAVNPLDPSNLVGGSKDFSLGEDERCGKYNVWSGVHVSHDGGRTWNHSLLPGYPGDTRKTALSDYACGSDPVVVFGPDGTAYYASIHAAYLRPHEVAQLSPVLGYDAGAASLAVTRSRDGGDTWDDPVILAARGDGDIIDKEWIAIDPDGSSLYVSYSVAGALWVQRSDDGAATWTEPVAVVRSQDPPNGPLVQQFAQIGVAPDHTVHFIYWSVHEAERASGVMHRSSDDRGATWSEVHFAADYVPLLDLEFTHKYRIVPMPALAVDNRTGALYVAYPTAHAGGLDVFLTVSTNGGASWTSPVRVNDDVPTPHNWQWMPAIAVGPDGTVHVTWMDYRDDPRGQFALVYYAFSTDVGRTFSPNVAVSSTPFDGTGGYHQSGAGTIGDYMGLAVSDLAVVPFWADTRNMRNDVFAAIILS